MSGQTKNKHQNMPTQPDPNANRAANRARMPEVSRIVDEFREAFGPQVRAFYAKEGGVEMGTSSAQLLPLP